MFGRRDAKGGAYTAALKKGGSTAGRVGGHVAMEFGPDVLRMVGNDANQILMQKLLNSPGPAPQMQAPAPYYQVPAPPPQAPAPPAEGQASQPQPQGQAPQPQNQTVQPQDPAPQPQRRDPNWESALAKEAAHLFKEYSPDVGASIMKTTANKISQNQQQNQQQQQPPNRRDPNLIKTLGADFKKVAHGAEQFAKTVGPTALKYAPELAGALTARDLQLAARDLEALEARNPSFFKSLGADFKKVAHGAEHLAETVGPIALQYAPEIAGAVLMARDLDAIARALEARDPNFFKKIGGEVKESAKAVGKGARKVVKTVGPTVKKEVKGAENLALIYGPDIAMALPEHQGAGKKARDLGWEGDLVRRGAEPEGLFEELYERDAEPEVDFEDLYERDTEAGTYFDRVFERDIGYFEEGAY